MEHHAFDIHSDQQERRGLDTMREGESAYLEEIDRAHPLYERLTDLGWILGTRIDCVRVSPLGDPVAYRIRGSILALRRQDSQGILIRSEVKRS